MQFFIALLPILVLLFSIIVLKRSVVVSAAVALVALLFAGVYWGFNTTTVTAATLRGFFLATEIIVIIFSALIIMNFARARGLFELFQDRIQTISGDYRVQTMLVSFGVVYFVEGVAGFGTPAVIAVPLFIVLGYKPIMAVALSLIADSIPVSFGAIGLPITFGIGSVVESIATTNVAETMPSVINLVAAINIIMSMLLALVLTGIVVRLNNGTLKHFTEFIPFALLSGFVVSAVGFLTAIIIGPELPSALGGLAGLFFIGFIAKKGIALPRNILHHPQYKNNSTSKLANKKRSVATEHKHMSVALTVAPYVLLITLLISTRLPYLPLGDWLRTVQLGSSSLLGSSVNYTIAPLYAAATILLISALLAVVLSWRSVQDPHKIIHHTFLTIKRPYVALLLVLSFVQIFIFSEGKNIVDSMPVVIAETIGSVSGSFWPFIVPGIGALGSFMSGSATVSNLIFTGLQYDIALNGGFNFVAMVSLQTVGASIGNMIALHNIIAALAIAGLSEKFTHKIIKKNALPLVILLFSIGCIGLVVAELY